jgi:hypothetical protein
VAKDLSYVTRETFQVGGPGVGPLDGDVGTKQDSEKGAFTSVTLGTLIVRLDYKDGFDLPPVDQ